MLILHPSAVRFGSTTLENVTAATLDREAAREAVDRPDHGPHPTFADVPAQRTTLTIRQHLHREDLGGAEPTTLLRPGTQAALSLCTAPAASDQSRRRFTATAVLLSSQVQLKGDAGAAAGVSAIRTLTFILLSADGVSDPLTVADAGAEL